MQWCDCDGSRNFELRGNKSLGYPTVMYTIVWRAGRLYQYINLNLQHLFGLVWKQFCAYMWLDIFCTRHRQNTNLASPSMPRSCSLCLYFVLVQHGIQYPWRHDKKAWKRYLFYPHTKVRFGFSRSQYLHIWNHIFKIRWTELELGFRQ